MNYCWQEKAIKFQLYNQCKIIIKPFRRMFCVHNNNINGSKQMQMHSESNKINSNEAEIKGKAKINYFSPYKKKTDS